MKMIYSKIKYFKKNIDISNNKLFEEICKQEIIKNSIYMVENSQIKFIKKEEKIQENIFLIYNDEVYKFYKNIQSIMNYVYNLYDLNNEIHKFMIYGKIKEYNKEQSKTWYDFPGSNLPFLYCIYNLSNNNISITLKNNNQIENIVLNPSDIFINKPTDLVKFDLEEKSNLLEIYISPLDYIKNNHNGVWIPL